MENEVISRLFRQYYNEAKLYTYTLCRDMELAEEIVSESFFKAVVTIDEEKDGFKFWLFKVCRNRFIDHTRKAKKSSALNDATMSSGEDVADALIAREEYSALYKAIERLPEMYREVVMLHYFDGLKVSEISALIEQSPENVKVLLFRARTKLKDMLSKDF